MAHYSQVYNVDEHDSNINLVYHSTSHPPHPSNYGFTNVKKQESTAAADERDSYAVGQRLMQEYESTKPHPRILQRQPWQRRVGYFGWWILGLGTVVILASCAFLVYLWYGAYLARKQLPRPEFWDSIIFSNHTAQVVTLCSAATRTAMDFQIGLLAASMAAIILETTGARLSDLVSLSLSRAFIDGASPWEIFLIARHRTFHQKKAVIFNWLIPLLSFLVGLAMTFASTILLSDFQLVQMAAPRTTKSIALGFDVQKAMADPAGTSYWQSKPQAHWRFAEARPSSTDNDSTLEYVSDTGDIYQASLPFDTMGERASLEYYDGPAIVTNSRTVCVAPTFTSATLEYVYTGSHVTEGLYLHAEIDTSTSWESGPRINGSQVAQISCRLNNCWDKTSNLWHLSLCSFLNIGNDAVNASLRDPLSGRPYTFQSVLLLNSSSILNINEALTEWTGSSENWATVEAIGALSMPKFVKDGPWTTAFAANGSEMLQASVCFTAPSMPLLYNVTMSGKAISSEPKSQAKYKDLKLKSQDGTKFLEQLGIGIPSLDPDARGILDLKIRSDPQSLATKDFAVMDAAIYNMIRLTLFDYHIAGGWTFNNDAVMGYPESAMFWPAHPEHSFLVQKILKSTGDPAIAVQALFTRFSQMIFHDMLPYWTREQSIVTVNAKRVLVPSQLKGLTIVLALVISHLALTLVTVALFLTSTKLSMLGNAWQTVSQIVSPETSAVVQAVSNGGMTDEEVHKWVTTTDFDEQVYSLSTSVDNVGLKVRRR
ncbi:hypothetical protein FSPOR_4663 [Fusarium sporotrichioides]|uniref:Uncharacterized protein n=1 Tax=Fusarium sporotrichioides TaxID=5514 RepID=A0A395SBV0_FUSSP|nr:hypothetical protein FSPOR_4663 [Fusarium sporotrichioides]